MSNPYKIEGPAVISFSGGRTSGYMLWHILDAHGGKLPEDVYVCFANVGKERLETLDFIEKCSTRWGVHVNWVEWHNAKPCYRVVTHATASRNGEPFEALIRKRGYTPNPIMRICTQYLKIETMKQFIKRELGLVDWTTSVGIRADEPRRWRILGEDKRNPHEFKVSPLKDAGVIESAVMDFWDAQTFDLGLNQWEGNCDLCFLKGQVKRRRIIHDRPDLTAWWINIEENVGRPFRAHGPTYAQLAEQVRRQTEFPFLDDPTQCDIDSLGDCFCGD